MSAGTHAPQHVRAQRRQPPPAGEPPPEAAQTLVSTPAPAHGAAHRVAGAMSIVLAVLHAKAMVDHAPHYWLFGALFGLLTCWQTAWGALAYRVRLRRRALLAGAWVNAAVVVVWLISRTIGMPIGPWAGEAEAIGVIDVMASLDALVVVALVVSLVSASERPRLAWLRGAYAVRLGMMLGSASLFAITIGGHTH